MTKGGGLGRPLLPAPQPDRLKLVIWRKFEFARNDNRRARKNVVKYSRIKGPQGGFAPLSGEAGGMMREERIWSCRKF